MNRTPFNFYAIHSINYYVTRWSIDTLTQKESVTNEN